MKIKIHWKPNWDIDVKLEKKILKQFSVPIPIPLH